MIRGLLYRALAFVDGYWHGYVCPIVERLAPESDEPEPLPEWECPACGHTTRARMADR